MTSCMHVSALTLLKLMLDMTSFSWTRLCTFTQTALLQSDNGHFERTATEGPSSFVRIPATGYPHLVEPDFDISLVASEKGMKGCHWRMGYKIEVPMAILLLLARHCSMGRFILIHQPECTCSAAMTLWLLFTALNIVTGCSKHQAVMTIGAKSLRHEGSDQG